MLLVNDFSEPLAPELVSSIESFSAQLVSSGIAPIVNETATELEAQAVLLRGQRPLASPELAFALRRWVATQPEVDVLIWLEPSAGDEGVSLRYGLFGPHDSAFTQGRFSALAESAARKAIDYATP